MYIVFKGLEDWFKENPGLKDRFKNTEASILKAIRLYTSAMRDNIENKTGIKIKVTVSDTLLKQALIDAYDDLKRLTNYHFTDDPNPIKEMSYIVYWLIHRKAIVLSTEDIVYDGRLSDLIKTKLIFINESFCVKLLFGATFPKELVRQDMGALLDNGLSQFKYYENYLLYYLVYRMDSPKSLEATVLALTVDNPYVVDSIIWYAPTDPLEDY